MAAAAHRAAHQVLEQGRIFADGLALRILGQDAEAVATEATAHPSRRGMRYFIAARSHFAESMLGSGVQHREVRQVVVLGAGLDTFAYRNTYGSRIQVFEADHPATQAWKRRRLEEAGITLPANLTFVPVDFEQDALLASLSSAGFSPGVRSFFLWLGVVPYLTNAAVRDTLRVIGRLPGGAEVVFDYADPPSTFSSALKSAHAARAERVATLGEPWLTYFEPTELAELLRLSGFGTVEDLGPAALATRYWPAATKPAGDRGGHVLFAGTSP
ncbi:MAG: SAM-dependent methyltransferase [Gemmatimonadota bacterium]